MASESCIPPYPPIAPSSNRRYENTAYALHGTGAWRYSSESLNWMYGSAVWTGSRVRRIRRGWDECDCCCCWSFRYDGEENIHQPGRGIFVGATTTVDALI